MPTPPRLFGRILWSRGRVPDAVWAPLGEIVDTYTREHGGTVERVLVALSEKGEITERVLKETHNDPDSDEQLLVLPPGQHPATNIPGGEPPDDDAVGARLTI